GVVTGLATMLVYGLGHTSAFAESNKVNQSAATLVLVALGLWVLYELARPLDQVRRILIAAMAAMGVGAFTVPFVADFFSLEVPPADYLMVIASVVVVAAA